MGNLSPSFNATAQYSTLTNLADPTRIDVCAQFFKTRVARSLRLLRWRVSKRALKKRFFIS